MRADTESKVRSRPVLAALLAVVTGAFYAAALPPLGIWPLAWLVSARTMPCWCFG